MSDKNNFDHNVRRNHPERRKSNKNILIGVVAGTFVVAFAIIISLYMIKERYHKTHFMKGTIINDIDVSGMTIQDVNQKIRQYNLTITERTSDGETVEEIIGGDELGLQLASTDELNDILKSQSKGKWLFGSGQTYTVDDFVKYDQKYYEECMGYLQCFSDDFIVKPSDAYISEYDETEKAFKIIAENQGNLLDEKKAKQLISDKILRLDQKLDLEKEKCYKQPKITSDDNELNTLLNNMNQFVDVTITYTFGKNKEVVDGSLISNWLTIGENQQVSLNMDCVKDYVATLRKRYDTIFRPRTFKTSYGKEVTIKDGDYGWWMNYGKEATELAAMINARESGERTPVYYQTAASYDGKDYGDTYIEVNLTAQHLFYYEDGELVLESDFVSGNSSRGNATNEGVFGITYKQRNATLVGEDYETPVSYWMPFNGHIGLHDATWRSEFGSELYKKNGSHGCVNLPYAVAKELYGRIQQGTPVICYKLKGTKSEQITVQTDEEIAQSAIDRISEIGNVTKGSEKVITRARTVYEELNVAQKKLVTNYDKLVEAEKKYKELTKK